MRQLLSPPHSDLWFPPTFPRLWKSLSCGSSYSLENVSSSACWPNDTAEQPAASCSGFSHVCLPSLTKTEASHLDQAIHWLQDKSCNQAIFTLKSCEKLLFLSAFGLPVVWQNSLKMENKSNLLVFTVLLFFPQNPHRG